MDVAAITMVFNEARFLSMWRAHYGSLLGSENLFVIDDGSTDGSTATVAASNLIRRSKIEFNEVERALLISFFHRELLTAYRSVIYVDVDEWLIPDPNSGLSLRELALQPGPGVIRAIGLNIVHNLRSEPAFNIERPVFRQRQTVQFEFGYCKPAIARTPVLWSAGFHQCNYPPHYDPRLFLFHGRALDYDIAKTRIENLNRVKFSSAAIEERQSWHFRLKPEDYLKSYFEVGDLANDGPFDFEDDIRAAQTASGDHKAGRLVRVPDRFADALNFSVTPPAKPSPIRADFAHKAYDRAIASLIKATPERPRNSQCPCGSGKRVKHCHGR